MIISVQTAEVTVNGENVVKCECGSKTVRFSTIKLLPICMNPNLLRQDPATVALFEGGKHTKPYDIIVAFCLSA